MIAVLIGTRLKNFQNTFGLKDSLQTQLVFLKDYFETPGSAFIASVLYLIFGLTFMNILIFTVNHFLSKKISMIGQATAYLLLIIGLHSDTDDVFPWLFLNKYLILHHALSHSKGYCYSFIMIEILLLILCYIAFDKYWWKSFHHKKRLLAKGMNQWYLKILFRKRELSIILMISVVSILFHIIFQSGLTLPDLIMTQFWGHGIGYFSLMDFLNMLVYNGLPIYFLCAFYQNCKTNSNVTVIIRFRNKKIWMDEILKVSVLLCASYVTMTVGLTICLGFLFHLEPQGYQMMKEIFLMGEIAEPNIDIATLQFLVSKTLELELLYIIIILLDSCLHNVAISFIILLMAHGLCVLPLKYVEYSPIGIAFLSRQYSITTGKDNYSMNLMVLALSVLVAYISLRHWRTEKILEEK